MDYERLREDLKNYFGTAMQFYPIALIELVEVEQASNEQLEEIAEKNGFDLSDYQNNKTKYRSY